ncbi:MAG: dTDP-4-dehydrorhamnose 3,5-epimerase [Candidatus Parcubacteria bacterium]|jgi:dTDP-4-dehydrorhamnose 3,5-epimerase
MKITKTTLPGVFSITPDIFSDDRGSLIKSFHGPTLKAEGLVSNLEQSLCSISKKGVFRGMHFQTPPKEQVKIVYVAQGAILDVILDLRKGSPTYKQYVTLELSADNNVMAYIPAGCAHGFLSLADNTRVIYLQDHIQSPENEAGVHMNSFGMKWDISNPIMSKKDSVLPTLAEYESPFIYQDTNENIN